MKRSVFKLWIIVIVVATSLILFNSQVYAQALEVVTVPWVPGNPAIPHDTYNGVETTFMAIARGGDGTYTYEWDFNGDGTYDFSTTTGNRYDLSTKYNYPAQVSDRLFIAKIRVTSGGETVEKEYRVMVHEPAIRDVRVNRAIDNALWLLHQHLSRSTTSSGVEIGTYPSQTLGAVGMAVQAWAIQGHKVNGDYATNPYVEDVRRGLNYCLRRTYSLPITIQPAGNPDSNANGIGLYSNFQNQMYETGIVLMALANSGDPDFVADPNLGPPVGGISFKEIVQDMVDFLAFAQNENSVWRGGWRYGPNNPDSDMSVTQWPVIGLEAAESNPDFGSLITVPPWVKTELREYFLVYDQGADGGFGYIAPGSNVPRTGAGLACQAWVGLLETNSNVQRAITYLDNNWTRTGNEGNLGNFYAMYAINKGMRGFDPDIENIGARDWYVEYSNWLITNQASDGGWSDCCWFAPSRDLTTAAGVLILVKAIIEPPPVAVAAAEPKEAPPGAFIWFDHSGSFHLDPARTLVAFRWDFDEDGTWDLETADINTRPTWVYNDNIGCGDEVVHRVVLEVEDDKGKTDQDTERVVIKINLFNHPPVADGDPMDSDPNYTVSKGGRVVLDASDSYDPDTGAPLKCDPNAPDDHIVKYEWDLNNDGIYDVEGMTYLFDTPDDWAIGSTHTVQLRVTDDGSWAGPDGGGSKSAETTVTILVVPSTPVAFDIKPRSCPNPIARKDKGVLPAAILGTADIDVAQIDPATLCLSYMGECVKPIGWAYEDVAAPYTPFTGKQNCSDCSTAGKDGYMDLSLKFDAQTIASQITTVDNKACLILTITGKLRDEFGGGQIVGEDVVTALVK